MITVTYPVEFFDVGTDSLIETYMEGFGFRRVGSGAGMGDRDMEFEAQPGCDEDEFAMRADTHAAIITQRCLDGVVVKISHWIDVH